MKPTALLLALFLAGCASSDRWARAAGAFGNAVNTPEARAQAQQEAAQLEQARQEAERRRPITCVNMGGGMMSCR